jgi:hypothetical protein
MADLEAQDLRRDVLSGDRVVDDLLRDREADVDQRKADRGDDQQQHLVAPGVAKDILEEGPFHASWGLSSVLRAKPIAGRRQQRTWRPGDGKHWTGWNVRSRSASSQWSSRGIRGCRRPSLRRSCTRSRSAGLPLALYSLRHPTDREAHPIHDEIRAPRRLPARISVPRAFARRTRVACEVAGCRDTGRFWATWWRDLRRDLTASRVRRLGQAFVWRRSCPPAWLRCTRTSCTRPRRSRGTPLCSAACRGAAPPTRRTSGRHPNGRSARNSRIAPG